MYVGGMMMRLRPRGQDHRCGHFMQLSAAVLGSRHTRTAGRRVAAAAPLT
jgi:hypothetical protein